MKTEFECTLEELSECKNVDIWGAAFLWCEKMGAEYNFCIDGNGENCSAIYKMAEDENGIMHTDYDTFVHYEVEFVEDWRNNLRKAMESAIKEFFNYS